MIKENIVHTTKKVAVIAGLGLTAYGFAQSVYAHEDKVVAESRAETYEASGNEALAGAYAVEALDSAGERNKNLGFLALGIGGMVAVIGADSLRRNQPRPSL